MTALQQPPSAPAGPSAPSHRSAAGRSGGRRLSPQVLAPRPRSTSHGAVAWASAALGLLVGWAVLYALCLSSFEHAHDQSVLYSQFRQELSEATAPLGGTIAPGSPVGLLSMPSAGLHDEVIVEGTAAGELQKGPGHKRDSPLPGQAGVSLVYGRATLFGGPFGGIADASPGDAITVRTGEGLAKYVVERVRRPGDPFSPSLAVGAGRLTLVTSEGTGWRSGWAPSRAVYVDASLASTPFGTPAGRPQSVPRSETALQADPGALYVLVLWLPVLLAGVVAGVWMTNRWGRWQAWIVGVPVVVAGLWGVSESAVQLLPNLM